MIKDEPTKEVQLQLIEQEMIMWRNTLYMYNLRYRVNKKLKNPPDVLKTIEDDMVKAEMAIEELETIHKEIINNAKKK